MEQQTYKIFEYGLAMSGLQHNPIISEGLENYFLGKGKTLSKGQLLFDNGLLFLSLS